MSTVEIIQENPNSPVFTLYLNRTRYNNALSNQFFTEFPLAIESLDHNPHVSVIILSGKGTHFCSGIDLSALSSITADVNTSTDRGRSGEKLRRHIKFMQEAITAIEKCRKPMISAVHGACIGGGVDIITTYLSTTTSSSRSHFSSIYSYLFASNSTQSNQNSVNNTTESPPTRNQTVQSGIDYVKMNQTVVSLNQTVVMNLFDFAFLFEVICYEFV